MEPTVRPGIEATIAHKPPDPAPAAGRHHRCFTRDGRQAGQTVRQRPRPVDQDAGRIRPVESRAAHGMRNRTYPDPPRGERLRRGGEKSTSNAEQWTMAPAVRPYWFRPMECGNARLIACPAMKVT